MIVEERKVTYLIWVYRNKMSEIKLNELKLSNLMEILEIKC